MSEINHRLQFLGNQTKDNIKALYLQENDRVLTLGFSGGKDSSLCVSLLLEALMEIPEHQRTKEVFILFSDTLMELLPVQVHTYKVLEKIRAFSKSNKLPITILYAKPKVEHTMWSMIIGGGTRPSSRDNRWCTDRLKVLVQRDILTNTFGTTNVESISIVGSRREESVDRAQRLENNSLEGHLKGHSEFDKTLVYAPIEYFSTEDVWRELRLSKYGNSVLDADELWLLYASTNGEGEECQTILGNANENGKNPGCSKSGGRFGCWCCPLVQNKDKALVGMMSSYSYIKYLIEYRDYVVSLRDGNWHLYRDVYEHGDGNTNPSAGKRNQYSYDNHRFGMTCPGGLNLETRKELLKRLLETEKHVYEHTQIQLVSDEELNYIQSRWLLEGDFELSAKSIAEEYNRSVVVSEENVILLNYAKVLYDCRKTWKARVFFWFNQAVNERWCIQFASQMIATHGHKALIDVLKETVEFDNKNSVADALKTIQLRKQFYPNESLEKLIRKEWRDDEIGYMTKVLLGDHLEEYREIPEPNYTTKDGKPGYDVFDDPNVSMEDKYAILDNWRYYQNEDNEYKTSHPEYPRYKGNANYIHFRDKLEKPSEKKLKPKPKNLFDFAVA